MSKETSKDPLSAARSIFGWGLISVVLWGFLIFLLTSCVCPQPEETRPILKPAIKKIYVAGELNADALAELEKARRIAEAAEQDVAAAQELVALMEEVGSAFAPNVKVFVSSYGSQILELKAQIAATNVILQEQGLSLAVAKQELDAAQLQLEASEIEKANLRAAAAKAQKSADKYKAKYDALKKYRYAIIGMAVWLLLKIVGSLGAWTPQGRIARTLIG